MLTIKTADYRLPPRPALDDKLDVWVFLSDRLDVVEQECPGVCVGWPMITVLENEFSDLWNERLVAIGGLGDERASEEGSAGDWQVH